MKSYVAEEVVSLRLFVDGSLSQTFAPISSEAVAG